MEIGGTKLNYAELAFLLTQLSTYLKAGIPLIDSIKILERQTQKPSKKRIYSNIVYELSKGVNIEINDDLFVVTLSIPCKPLWENDGETVILKFGEEIKYYYGRTTLNSQTDYYFKFRIIKKN